MRAIPAPTTSGTITAIATTTATSATNTVMVQVTIDPHPLLAADMFESRFPNPLADMTSLALGCRRADRAR